MHNTNLCVRKFIYKSIFQRHFQWCSCFHPKHVPNKDGPKGEYVTDTTTKLCVGGVGGGGGRGLGN
jgi:hypothetical protein